MKLERLPARQVPVLRLPWGSRCDRDTLMRYATQWPHLAWRVSGTGEYVVGSYWRGRADIGMVAETSSARHRSILLDHLIAQFVAEGCGAVVLSDCEGSREQHWYVANGWQPLEKIVLLEVEDCRRTPSLPLTVGVSAFASAALTEVMAVERESFPWLWWKSEAEFLEYATRTGVHVYTARAGEEMVGYVGFTVQMGRGHLDRLAVRGAEQHRGYGSQLLSYALGQMSGAGIRRVSLSTQWDNWRSQRLYHRFGFRPTGQQYSIRGVWLRQPGAPAAGG